MKRERWEEIQAGEFDYHAAKDESRILDHKVPYWRALIAALPDAVRFDASTRVLDLGCGGCSILLALEEGDLVGIDPLMDRYREKFTYLEDRTDIRWINGMAEELDLEEPFDVVFCVNALDHVHDPRVVAGHIARLTRPGGHCVVTMNAHTTRFFRAYYQALYRVIDSHHPYQFRPDDVVALFDGFSPVEVRRIDDLWLPFADGYYREVLKRPFESRRKWLRAAKNPFKWPMGFCKFVLDMPPHRKKPGQRSIYGDYLFVLRRDAGGTPRPATA